MTAFKKARSIPPITRLISGLKVKQQSTGQPGIFIRYTAYDAKANRMCQVLIGGHSQLIAESDIRQFK
jgi:hypothetical protein